MRRLALLLVLIASLRIVSTYKPLSHTTDEPAHLACGMQYLATGQYLYEDQHPPLARLIGAAGLYLAGARYEGNPNMYSEGWRLLASNGRYTHNLFFARLAMLPLFWLACWVVYRWTRLLTDERSALYALGIFTLTPVILGHAGLVTTDFALTAFCGAAALASFELKTGPNVKRALILGCFIGLALLSKFSSLLFLPLLLQWNRRSVRWLPVALAVAAFLVAACYSFSVEPFFTGIDSLRDHNRTGHLSYLFGNLSMRGFRYYYPVVFAIKMPLAILVLLGFSRRWKLLLPVAAIIAVSSFSRINIGVRHILPVFLPLAVCAGIAAAQLPRRWAYALFAWLALSGALLHPDYISYTNELAGRHPENILVDSDLDWEQGMGRLNTRLYDLHADHVHLKTGIGYLNAHPFIPFDWMPNGDTPPHGWSAVSLTAWKLSRQPKWADTATPRERIGHSILLYWFP